MERIRSLGRYQKGILILMAAMVLLFTALYPIVLSREGFLYRDALLIPREEGGNTVYAGKIEGQPASFTLYDDLRFSSGTAIRSTAPIPLKKPPTPFRTSTWGTGRLEWNSAAGRSLSSGAGRSARGTG